MAIKYDEKRLYIHSQSVYTALRNPDGSWKENRTIQKGWRYSARHKNQPPEASEDRLTWNQITELVKGLNNPENFVIDLWVDGEYQNFITVEEWLDYGDKYLMPNHPLKRVE